MKNNNLNIIRYTLGHNSQKFDCPVCGAKKRYRKYYDTQLMQYLPDTFGRCDRVNECHYDNSPYKDLKWLQEYESTNGNLSYEGLSFPPVEHVIKPLNVIDLTEQYKQCALRPRTDYLYQYFCTIFDKKIVDRVFNAYRVTTGKDNTTIFWQFDAKGRAITGKIMQYQQGTHKRDRDTPPSWVHARLKKAGQMPNDYEPQQELFGLHLLKEKSGTCAYIVESEKTALSCACEQLRQGKDMAFWLATGGANNTKLITRAIMPLTFHSCPVLLFPDSDFAGQKWLDFAKEKQLTVNNWVYEHCSDEQRANGCDFADIILKK